MALRASKVQTCVQPRVADLYMSLGTKAQVQVAVKRGGRQGMGRAGCMTCAVFPDRKSTMVQLITAKSSLRSYRGYLATSPWNPHPRLRSSLPDTGVSWHCAPLRLSLSLCVCVCARARAKEKERQRERERKRDRKREREREGEKSRERENKSLCLPCLIPLHFQLAMYA
jgi:hypothetical protein